MKRSVFIVVLCFVAACKDPVDQAAKKRIFSAEDPPQAIAAAKEKLPPEEAAASVTISRRILGMGAAETTERIGPHVYNASVTWEWSGGGGKNVRLKEFRELLSGPGGVSGDFIGRMGNTNELGLEVMRVGGKVFARSTYGKDGAGKFRQRARDRGMAERMREETSGALRDFDQLFRGRLKLNAQGTSTLEGRTAWKYVVSLADAPPEEEKLPPLATPKNGLDETTRRRRFFYDARTPRSIQGEVYVDADTSVVLKARLDGKLGVKADDGESELHLVVESSLTNIGKAPLIEAPKEFLPDEDKPDGVAAALTRFGIERKKGDAGVPAGTPGEPEDDAE